MSNGRAASRMAAWGFIPTTTNWRFSRVIAQCRRAGTAKFGIQLAHAGRKASSQRPWEGAKALEPGQDPWPTFGPSPLPWGEGWHVPREATEADLVARARGLCFLRQARAAHRLRRDRTAHGAWLSDAQLHLAVFQQAHGSIRRQLREPHALSARPLRARCAPSCRSPCRSVRAFPRSIGARAG